MPKSMDLARRIKAIREGLGFTQAEFAEAIGMKAHQVGDVERGTTDPSAWMLISIASMLQVDPRKLLLGEGEEGRRPAQEGELLAPDDLEVWKTIERHFARKPEVRLMVAWKPAQGRTFKKEDCVFLPVVAGADALLSPKLRDDQVLGYVPTMAAVAPNPETVRCFRLTDDDMDPFLPEGSILAVDLKQTDPQQCGGAFVCARDGAGNVLVRRFWSDGENWMLTWPDPTGMTNEPPVVLPIKSNPAPIIGRIVWAWVDLRKAR